MTEPLSTNHNHRENHLKLEVRRGLLHLSSHLKVTATANFLRQRLTGISKQQDWDSVQFSISVDEKELSIQEDWEFCDNQFVTLGLVVKELETLASDSISVPVGQIEMNQVGRLKHLWSQNRIDQSGTNLILVGMPGTGKSTVGKKLAERLSCSFYDLDELIQSESGKSLEEMIREQGYEHFLNVEADAAIKFAKENSVLATGGSVIYRPSAMLSLQNQGTIIYLETPIEELRKRLSDLKQRGVVLDESQSLEDLYNQREPFYECYHDLKIDTSQLTIDQTVDQIILQTSRGSAR